MHKKLKKKRTMNLNPRRMVDVFLLILGLFLLLPLLGCKDDNIWNKNLASQFLPKMVLEKLFTTATPDNMQES